MSLDLHIISPEPVIKHGTGIYIRENGQTLELKTMEEVQAHFPDKDLSHICEFDYEDEDFLLHLIRAGDDFRVEAGV